jgi:ribosomal protein S18 acetylase RimI-like enzyme
MSGTPAIPLRAVKILPDTDEYREIESWAYPSAPFYEAQIRRLLEVDIPYRFLHHGCIIWAYRNQKGNTVGFGTLDLSDEYIAYAGERLHPYIPLLAVNPEFRGQGHGTSIVEHLIGAAHLQTISQDCSNLLFLDVYTANKPAIGLYSKRG